MFKAGSLRLVTLGILAGCAAQPAKNQSTHKVNTAGTDVQCHSEQNASSLIVHTVCTTTAQRDAQQADLKDFRDIVEKPACACPGGKCPQ